MLLDHLTVADHPLRRGREASVKAALRGERHTSRSCARLPDGSTRPVAVLHAVINLAGIYDAGPLTWTGQARSSTSTRSAFCA